jgi:hypothetical protein
MGPTSPYTCVKLEQEVPSGGENISKLKQEVKEQGVWAVMPPATR